MMLNYMNTLAPAIPCEITVQNTTGEVSGIIWADRVWMFAKAHLMRPGDVIVITGVKSEETPNAV